MSENILRSKILVIESKPKAAHVIQTALTDSNTDPFDVEWVGQLSEGLVRLSTKGIAAVLLNFSLPDSYGIETLEKLLRVVPDVPVLVLGDTDNEAMAKQALERGAQDYLLQDHLDGYSLRRALRNAVGRKAIEDALYLERSGHKSPSTPSAKQSCALTLAARSPI